MDQQTIVLAGATGALGGRIARELRARSATVRALVRPGTSADRLASLRAQEVEIIEADLAARADVARACAGASCVVSALLGLRETLIDAQTELLEAAVEAGVPRFIPSDYAMDFSKIKPGANRNFDIHREFWERLDKAPIKATSILNGAFTSLLTGDAPIVLFKLRRVLYWGPNPHQPIDFTTMDDTAAFTAEAALDPTTPRILRIAGAQISAAGLAWAAGDATGKKFRLLRGGSLDRLKTIAKVTRTLSPDTGAAFPVWQGMQYLHAMFDGAGALTPLDNARYPKLKWTGVRPILQTAA